MKNMPKIENYRTHDGQELRELFALAVLRTLTPMELNSVINTLEKAK